MNTMKEEKIKYPSVESNEELGPLQQSRNQPPAHYRMKIGSFSQLGNMLKEFREYKYESASFKAGGYKWKLSLYPNGDEKRNGKGYISLYLVLAEENKLPLGAEVNVLLTFFIHNQILDNYLMLQDHKTRSFHAMKSEWGFPRLLDLTTFQDPANGYLIDDRCIFGAEVSIMKPSKCTGKGECIYIMKNPKANSFTWTIKRFSNKRYAYRSNVFSAVGLQWAILLYPKGERYSIAKDKSLSINLYLLEGSKISQQKIYVKFELRVMNQLRGTDHCRRTGCYRYSSSGDISGFADFLPLSDLNDASKGFILNNNLVVQAQILLLSATRHYF